MNPNFPPDYEGTDEPSEEQVQQRQRFEELDRDINRERELDEATNNLEECWIG